MYGTERERKPKESMVLRERKKCLWYWEREKPRGPCLFFSAVK